MMNRQRCITGLIFILGLMLGCGIWQQRSQAAGQARQWLQHFAPATGGNHVVGASAFGVSPAARRRDVCADVCRVRGNANPDAQRSNKTSALSATAPAIPSPQTISGAGRIPRMS